MDDLGERLIERVTALVKQRSGGDRRQFGAAIHRGHSWISEFFSETRTTNDLRLVVKMARYFRVPIGYLLGEDDHHEDAATLTLLGAWNDLERQQDRDAVLQLALILRRDREGSESHDPRHVGNGGATPRTAAPVPEPGRQKGRSR